MAQISWNVQSSGFPNFRATPIRLETTRSFTDSATESPGTSTRADAFSDALGHTSGRRMHFITRRRAESNDNVIFHILDIDAHTTRHIQRTNTEPNSRRDSLKWGNTDGKGLWGVKYEAGDGEDRAPLLQDEGIMYILRCRLFEEGVEGGLPQVRDHVMVVGEVVEVVDGGAGDGLEFGLAYADRKYREVGEVIPGK
ncbi:hypothetical protein CC79DRAFT_1364135 [Sarocladium strictum]